MNGTKPGLITEIASVKTLESCRKSFFLRVNPNGPLPDQSNPFYKGLECCHLWLGGKGSGGYGDFSPGKVRMLAHRAAFILAGGTIPPGLVVMHRCDNRLCVNPQHLNVGTMKQNIEDRDRKGRTACGLRSGAHTHPELHPRGDNHYSRKNPERLARGDKNGARLHPERMQRGVDRPASKLTESEVRNLRDLRASGWTLKELAQHFGVATSNVHLIVHRKGWSHVS